MSVDGAVVAWIALGSNLGDRRGHLDEAVRELARIEGARVVLVSSWIETAPVGGPEGQGSYLNGVAEIATELAPRALLERLQAIERAHGRDRSREVRNGPRTLDLDLLLHGNTIVREADLVVPHPRLHERAFVLEPFAEIGADVRVPGLERTVGELWAALDTTRSQSSSSTHGGASQPPIDPPNAARGLANGARARERGAGA